VFFVKIYISRGILEHLFVYFSELSDIAKKNFKGFIVRAQPFFPRLLVNPAWNEV
jgi:homoserine trans-succinylase